jgi:protein subunit release factor A
VIERDDIDVLVHRSDDPAAINVAVRLTHKATGISVESWDRDSQIANYDAALAELERRLQAVGEGG